MKTILTIATLSTALLLGACGGDPEQPKPAPTQAAKTEPAKPAAKPTNAIKTEQEIKAEQQQVHQSVETAMAAIPPQMRADFQKVWECQAKANAKPGATQVDMDGDWIVAKTAELKGNPALANCS